MLGYSRGKTGRVEGFPEPERAVRGAPEALRVLHGRDCQCGRELDYNA